MPLLFFSFREKKKKINFMAYTFLLHTRQTNIGHFDISLSSPRSLCFTVAGQTELTCTWRTGPSLTIRGQFSPTLPPDPNSRDQTHPGDDTFSLTNVWECSHL